MKKAAAAKPAADDVDAFMHALAHPLAAEIEEGIQGNAPSFRTIEWFATVIRRACSSGWERIEPA